MTNARTTILAAGVAALTVFALAGCGSQPQVASESPVAPPSGTETVKAFVRSGQDLVIRRDDVTVTITADGGDVDITGSGLTVTINGNVDDLILDGGSSTLTSKDAAWLEVIGNRNTVKSGSVSQTVLVEGERNTVTFGGSPSVRVRGTSNTVNGKIQ